jgi:hypothetical protein
VELTCENLSSFSLEGLRNSASMAVKHGSYPSFFKNNKWQSSYKYPFIWNLWVLCP